MRVAFVDLIFSWPPNGGADTDLYQVMAGLQQAGHQVHLFGVHELGSAERGLFEPLELPFPATRIDCTHQELSPSRGNLLPRLRKEVDAWRPDVVFVQHGYALKPYVLETLAHHRTVSRYYAHELACARDPLRFREGAPCPNDFLRTTQVCRACALQHQRTAIKSGRFNTWTSDYLAAEAYAPAYVARTRAALRHVQAIVVSNQELKHHLDGLHENVWVIPGGVFLKDIPPPTETQSGRKVIFMPGRVDDPLKGLHVLLEAVDKLDQTRDDFEVWTTHFDHTLTTKRVKALGWRTHAETLALYEQADIVVVPSVWEEPFGLVAVEAMAAAKPVCASAVGGLKGIVRDGETGFLFPRGDSAAVAVLLDRLLADPALRDTLGAAGRRVAEREYAWEVVIREHYEPLLESLMHG